MDEQVVKARGELEDAIVEAFQYAYAGELTERFLSAIEGLIDAKINAAKLGTENGS